MNRARAYVKNFDELENRNRLAILQTIRSAERSGTKVDELTVRGIANVMAARTAKGQSFAGELEVRFADGISQSGLYTHADGKPVIVINAKADSKEALRSTVAHELVHYLETRAGYKELAAYVWQTARAEKRDAIRKEYEDFYKENKIEYSEEDIHSEIVARLVGERLQSEKFLKRYAEKDASMIKRAAGFIKGLRKATKDADEEAERITGEIMLRMDRALAGADVKESDGGKKYDQATNATVIISKNINDVKIMGAVSKINGDEFRKSEVDLVTQVSAYFEQFGNVIENAELGKVTLDRRGVKDDIAHGIGRKKAASFAAVPDVIKSGKVVDYQTNWKNRGYDTAVIAAPIQIGDERHLMGIVLIRDQKNQSFYVHEVLTIAEGATPFKTGTVKTNGDTGGEAPSVLSILQKILSVNTSDQNNSNTQSITVKKYDLKKKNAEGKEEVSESFKNAVARMYEKETRQAQNTAEAFKEGNKVLNKKLEESRAETERYKAKGRSLARKIAEDAYETDAKTFTQKEVGELIERINSYSTEKFKDIMNERSATLSKADKEQFAFDIYVAFHVASADSHAIERIGVLADKLARQYLDNVYYTDDGSRFYLNEVVNEASYEVGRIIIFRKSMRQLKMTIKNREC